MSDQFKTRFWSENPSARDWWAARRPDPLKRFPPEPMPTLALRPEKWQTYREGS